jgi:hypothetical protein
MRHEAPPPEKVEVVFDGLSVEAEERAAGRRALPTLPNAFLNGAQVYYSYLLPLSLKNVIIVFQGVNQIVHLCTVFLFKKYILCISLTNILI